MPIYALGDIEPEIDPAAFVHPDAVIIGRVRLAAEASVWPCAYLESARRYRTELRRIG